MTATKPTYIVQPKNTLNKAAVFTPSSFLAYTNDVIIIADVADTVWGRHNYDGLTITPVSNTN